MIEADGAICPAGTADFKCCDGINAPRSVAVVFAVVSGEDDARFSDADVEGRSNVGAEAEEFMPRSRERAAPDVGQNGGGALVFGLVEDVWSIRA